MDTLNPWQGKLWTEIRCSCAECGREESHGNSLMNVTKASAAIYFNSIGWRCVPRKGWLCGPCLRKLRRPA